MAQQLAIIASKLPALVKVAKDGENIFLALFQCSVISSLCFGDRLRISRSRPGQLFRRRKAGLSNE